MKTENDNTSRIDRPERAKPKTVYVGGEMYFGNVGMAPTINVYAHHEETTSLYDNTFQTGYIECVEVEPSFIVEVWDGHHAHGSEKVIE